MKWNHFLDKIGQKNKSHKSPPLKTSFKENEQLLREKLSHCQDVIIATKQFQSKDQPVETLWIYNEGLSSHKQINELVFPCLQQLLESISVKEIQVNDVLNKWLYTDIKKEDQLEPLLRQIFAGQLALLIDGLEGAFLLNVADQPQRTPEESNTEIALLGSRDNFTENITVNVALIRKRLPTASLYYEKFTVGVRSKTSVGLLYIDDIARPEVITKVKKQLSEIRIDAISSYSDLIDYLTDYSPFTIFPLYDYTGRPDYVSNALLKGRFILLLDGIPTAMIAPVNLALLLKTPEDLHQSYLYVTVERFFRTIGLLVSFFLPGLYIAITTYHPDQIPLSLLSTLVLSRKGVPLSTPMEAIIMLILFELFREAGIRLPSAVGQTLSVVGGLIIGEAAIRAGLTSPTLLVVVATTAVSTFTLVNQSLQGVISVIRFGILIISSLIGIYGFLLSVFVVLIYLSNLRSFGVSYLAPISPFSFQDFIQGVLRIPIPYIKKRPQMTKSKDTRRQR
ncbi:spore germination protein [Hazenella coriacea]|uniref:GerA spore germination protein n=1 Tax=Hazenella coriacea TaxID=1179467 RepID=A0A4R3LBP0_9BACL|nr:spore germination protein [Hazenella coriacea]TCS96650.1 GerA spore germination protein [Hazenella coriacea]